MITIDDIKEELRIEDDTQNTVITRKLEMAKGYLAGYLNRETSYIDEKAALDEIVLYICVLNLNPDTRLRAGKQSENSGLSISFLDDLPKMYKTVLNGHRKMGFN